MFHVYSRTAAAVLITAFALVACNGGDKAASEAPPPPSAGTVPFAKLDFSALPDDFPAAMKIIKESQVWSPRTKAMNDETGGDPRLTMNLKMSADSLAAPRSLGCAFLNNWQLPEGNFRYMYDWTDKSWVEDDHQVRQAGSLWGVGTCYRHEATERGKEVLDKGLAFWFTNTVPGPVEGSLNLKYPGDPWMHSGTVALVALAIVEYLKSDAPMDEASTADLNTKLDGYLKFLQWMQLKNGHISDRFDHRSNKRRERSSPYYDGESLLAMTKAARQLDRAWLVPTIERAAASMAKTYTIKSWAKDRDSNETKGFFQWGSMSFAEYYVAGWKDKDLYGDVANSLGFWMIHTHRTLSRRRNHAYAIEGLVANWRIANLRKDIPAQTDLLFNLDRSLHKLFQWQIGGPLAPKNTWLKDQGKDDPLAVGGIMNARKPSGAPVKKDVSHQLRIDVTQHQMHATTMALEHVFVPVK